MCDGFYLLNLANFTRIGNVSTDLGFPVDAEKKIIIDAPEKIDARVIYPIKHGRTTILIGTSKALSEVVQKILFGKGFGWSGGSKEIQYHHIDKGQSLHLYPGERYLAYGSENNTTGTIIDARTEMGKVLELPNA